MLSVVTAVRDLGRLREITSVLVRHGFGEIVARAGFWKRPKALPPSASPEAENSTALALATDELPAGLAVAGEDERRRISTAERVRLVLEDLGPTFIKLGQIASTRNDLLPDDVIVELKKLQDNVPPVPFADIKQVVEMSLGVPLEQVFHSFDEAPLATASIGQVHRALLPVEGADEPLSVVVKVQRPNVGAIVQRDLVLCHMMAAAIERAIPETRIYSPIGLVRQFDRSITAELDYSIEAENGDRFTRNFEDTSEAALVRFPKAYKEASSKQVLTLEYFDGLKVDQAVRAGIDGKQVARNAVAIVVKMIFEDGFFHADPHPGNVIILRADEGGPPAPPVIGLIDLGMVGRLSPDLRDRTIDLMVAAIRKDPYAVADTMYAIGRPTKKIDMREYRADVGVLAEKYLGRPLKEIELSAMIRDLVASAMKYGIEIPTDFMLVGKALMTLEGIGKQLDPDLDIFTEAQPYFFRLLRQRYSPQRIGTDLLRGVEQLSRAGYDVPLQAREILEDLRLGRLQLTMRDPNLPVVADRLGRRLFSGLVVCASTVAGAIAFAHDHVLGGILLGLGGGLFVAHVVRDVARGARAGT